VLIERRSLPKTEGDDMAFGCRSSGVLGASKIIVTGKTKLVSIHAALFVTGGDAVTINVFDGTDNSGTKIAMISHSTNGYYNLEYDMHGVLCNTGLFLEVAEAGSSTVNVSIEFA
tara:strand:- start:3062 stop:3406 length:345 start_codon:yes stop_codon:yes gene_type:complete